MDYLGLFGIIFGFAFMTFGVYKNWSILYLSVMTAIIICLFNQVNITTALTETYILGFSAFAAPNFILFIEGAIFGKLFDDSGAAWRLGTTVVQKFGSKFALIGYMVVALILNYGGISTFVIFFVLLPLARPIWRETKTPWYLWPAITLTALIPGQCILPGGLQIHNIIPTAVLGTKVTAAPLMSIVIFIVFWALCGVYLVWEIKGAQKVEWKRDSLPPEVAEKGMEEFATTAPGALISLLPIVVALVSINIFNLLPIYGLALGILVACLCFYKSIPSMPKCLNAGAVNGVQPLIMVAAVVGIARVVSSTNAFESLRVALVSAGTGSGAVAGLSVIGITNLMSFICGSATGSVSMTIELFGEMWLNAGLTPDWIHRTVSVAAAGLDSMPWNSAIVLLIGLAGLDHKRAYPSLFVITVVFTILVSFVALPFI